MDNLLRTAKAVLNHWHEFGAQHGLSEVMDHLDSAVQAATAGENLTDRSMRAAPVAVQPASKPEAMSVADALLKVVEDIRAMPPDEFRKKLAERQNGPIATAFREAQEFIEDFTLCATSKEAAFNDSIKTGSRNEEASALISIKGQK